MACTITGTIIDRLACNLDVKNPLQPLDPTLIFTSDQLNYFKSMDPGAQLLAEDILKYSASMILMNLAYNSRYVYSPLNTFLIQNGKYGFSGNIWQPYGQILDYLYSSVQPNLQLYSTAGISEFSTATTILQDPLNSPYNKFLTSEWAYDTQNLSTYIANMINAAGDALPIFTGPLVNMLPAGPTPNTPLLTWTYQPTADTDLSKITFDMLPLFILAKANVLSALGDKGTMPSLIQLPSWNDGEIYDATQFAPRSDKLTDIGAALQLAFIYSSSATPSPYASSPQNSMEGLAYSLQQIFDMMYNSLNTHGIAPLLRLSGIDKLLIAGTNLNLARAAEYSDPVYYNGKIVGTKIIGGGAVGFLDGPGTYQFSTSPSDSSAFSLYSRLLQITDPIFMEKNFGLSLRQAASMNADAQANALAPQMDTNAVLLQLQSINADLNQILQYQQQNANQLSNIYSTLNNIDEHTANIQNDMKTSSDKLDKADSVLGIVHNSMGILSTGMEIFAHLA